MLKMQDSVDVLVSMGLENLKRQRTIPPKKRFQAMVEAGLITPRGKLDFSHVRTVPIRELEKSEYIDLGNGVLIRKVT